uniref:Cnidarian restricted protein n=1 Tax=Clytia hemisphaerica TaxID=252671 RepID=A0A7M5V2Y2_9CNID|eukprot:TCONS_00024609-protein
MYLMYVFFCCYLLVALQRAQEIKNCQINSFYDDIDEDHENKEMKLTVDVYDCSNTLIPAKETCTLLKKDWILNKGEAVDLNFSLYDYKTEVKFFGRTLCVGHRDYNLNDTEAGVHIGPGSYTCSHKCMDMLDTSDGKSDVPQNVDGVLWAGYERMKKCGGEGGCVWADSKYLKFVNTKTSGSKGLKKCERMEGSDDEILAQSITVNVLNCQNSIIPRKETCDDEPIKRNLYLPKGKMVNLNYDIYGYDVQAYFRGRKLCVGWRAYHANETTYRCRRDCEDMFEKTDGEGWDDEDGAVWASYERMKKCKDSGCIGSGSKYLKFVNVTNPPPRNHAYAMKSNTGFITLLFLSGLMMKLVHG